jgi:hypothetical protein
VKANKSASSTSMVNSGLTSTWRLSPGRCGRMCRERGLRQYLDVWSRFPWSSGPQTAFEEIAVDERQHGHG